jgi:AraC-like DNA-binding protein
MDSTWLTRLTKTLDARFKDRIRLADLAHDVQRHPGYVSREFRRHYGETLTTYIGRHRISEARILLEDHGKTIAAIASELGYHDESHFSHAFKRAVGSPPGRYRRALRSCVPSR